MSRRMTLGLALSLALVCLFSMNADAAVLTVDCEDGPFFEIGPAVAAAAPGDTVLVRRCVTRPYAAFVVEGKDRVHIIGRSLPSRDQVPTRDFRPPVVISATLPDIVCARISNSTGVTLRGFTFEDCRFHSIENSGSTDTRVIGNRFERGGEETVRDASERSQYVGNVVTDSGFSFFLSGTGALVARNLIIDNRLGGIESIGTDSHIVDNRVFRNGSECVGDQGDETRIEGNVCLGNLIVNGRAEISLRSGSTNPDVIGNVTGDSIADFSDTGADLADNR